MSVVGGGVAGRMSPSTPPATPQSPPPKPNDDLPSSQLREAMQSLDFWRAVSLGVPLQSRTSFFWSFSLRILSIFVSGAWFAFGSMFPLLGLYMIDGENPRGPLQPLKNWWTAILPTLVVFPVTVRALVLDTPNSAVHQVLSALGDALDATHRFAPKQGGRGGGRGGGMAAVMPREGSMGVGEHGVGSLSSIVEDARSWAVRSLLTVPVATLVVITPLLGVFMSFDAIQNASERFGWGLSDAQAWMLIFLLAPVGAYAYLPDRRSTLLADTTSAILAGTIDSFSLRLSRTLRAEASFPEAEVLQVHRQLKVACQSWSKAFGTTVLLRAITVVVLLVCNIPLFFSEPKFNVYVAVSSLFVVLHFGDQFRPLVEINAAANRLEAVVANARLLALQTLPHTSQSNLPDTHAQAALAYLLLLTSQPLGVQAAGVRLDQARASALATLFFTVAGLFLRSAIDGSLHFVTLPLPPPSPTCFPRNRPPPKPNPTPTPSYPPPCTYFLNNCGFWHAVESLGWNDGVEEGRRREVRELVRRVVGVEDDRIGEEGWEELEQGVEWGDVGWVWGEVCRMGWEGRIGGLMGLRARKGWKEGGVDGGKWGGRGLRMLGWGEEGVRVNRAIEREAPRDVVFGLLKRVGRGFGVGRVCVEVESVVEKDVNLLEYLKEWVVESGVKLGEVGGENVGKVMELVRGEVVVDDKKFLQDVQRFERVSWRVDAIEAHAGLPREMEEHLATCRLKKLDLYLSDVGDDGLARILGNGNGLYCMVVLDVRCCFLHEKGLMVLMQMGRERKMPNLTHLRIGEGNVFSEKVCQSLGDVLEAGRGWPKLQVLVMGRAEGVGLESMRSVVRGMVGMMEARVVNFERIRRVDVDQVCRLLGDGVCRRLRHLDVNVDVVGFAKIAKALWRSGRLWDVVVSTGFLERFVVTDTKMFLQWDEEDEDVVGVEKNRTRTLGPIDRGLVAQSLVGDLEGVKLMVYEGRDVERPGTLGRTPLIAAAKEGHEGVVEFLLEHGAAVNAVDESKCSALHYASTLNHESVVQLLLDHGATREKDP